MDHFDRSRTEAQGNATCGFFPLNPFFPSLRTGWPDAQLEGPVFRGHRDLVSDLQEAGQARVETGAAIWNSIQLLEWSAGSRSWFGV